MVELERTGIPVVATQAAPAARLGEQDLLDASPPSCDPGDPALGAAIPAGAAHATKGCPSMEPALADDLVGFRLVASHVSGGLGSETVATQPVANGRWAESTCRRDLANRKAPLDEGTELGVIDSAT